MVGVKWTKAAWNVRCVRADDWQTTDMTSEGDWTGEGNCL